MRPGPTILLALALMPISLRAQQHPQKVEQPHASLLLGKPINGLFWTNTIGISLLCIAGLGAWAGISDANERSRKSKIAIEGLTAHFRKQNEEGPDF